MTITENKDGDVLTLVIDGKVDTISAPQLQSAILSAFQKSNNVTLDCTQLLYTSSAGLRAFLIGQKTAAAKGGQLKLIHVSEAVRVVLKGTGFDKILTIE